MSSKKRKLTRLFQVGGKFMIQTENDVELFLSADYAIGIKDNPALSFNAHVEQVSRHRC